MNESNTPIPELSIVVPAYNEAERLPRTLVEIDQYILTSCLTVELIVADDGSGDATAAIARDFQPASASYRVLELPHRGKAATVRDGMLAAHGRFVLFTDADLSTPMEYADPLLDALRDGADIAIGSREGTGANRVDEPAYRHMMGRIFNGLVRLLAVSGISDTQCGFKAFRQDVARDLFSRLRVHDTEATIRGPRVTGFDVEVLFLARRSGYTIVEVPVFWRHVSGSKVDPLRDTFRMFADVVRVRWAAIRGQYDV